MNGTHVMSPFELEYRYMPRKNGPQYVESSTLATSNVNSWNEYFIHTFKKATYNIFISFNTDFLI